MRIAVFTGPSGGHFYPALAFVEAFKKRRPEAQFLFLTGKRGKFLVDRTRGSIDAEFILLTDSPFPRLKAMDFVIRVPSFLLKLMRAYFETREAIEHFKPDLAVGFGSYVSGPGLWLSSRKKIPVLIHEQNCKMGKANARLRRFAQRIALSFEGGEGEVTGFPLRSSLVRQAARVNRVAPAPPPAGQLKILILGGSQGARGLNRLWMEALRAFSFEEKRKIAVIHITGEEDFKEAETVYFSEGVEAKVHRFSEKMEEVYSGADFVVSRAGAGTLFELALFGLPSILLPYSHADGHQELNARYFETRNAALVLSEREADPQKLKRMVQQLVNSESLRNRFSTNLKGLAHPDAADRLVDLAEGLLK